MPLYHEQFDRFLTEYFESGILKRWWPATREMIAPYVRQDPTAFCSYADFLTGVQTITDFCLLRAESARGQLEGTVPSTIRGQTEDSSAFVDGSSVWLPDMARSPIWRTE